MAVNVMGGAATACWVMVNVWGPTWMLPVREELGLAAARYVSVLVPDPPGADVIWSQLESLKALHGQMAPIVTLTFPSVASAPMVAVVGEIVRLLGEPSSVMLSNVVGML